MIIGMDAEKRKQIYDEIVDREQSRTPASRSRATSCAFELYYVALFDYCETPEEILAAQLVVSRSYTPHSKSPTKRYPEFAHIRWPWGDARGVLSAGGRTYFEARLRLRDKLVESARALVAKDAP
jgi:hypothetical protein